MRGSVGDIVLTKILCTFFTSNLLRGMEVFSGTWNENINIS